MAASVPGADHQLALVIAVNQAHQVAQHNAVFVAQTRARQDHGGEVRVFEVDRYAGWHQLPGIGQQVQGRVQACAQIEPCTAGRGIGRQLLGHARVDDLHLNIHHDLSPAPIRWAISVIN